MEFDLENPLTSIKEHQIDTIPMLFSSESDHMPSSPTVSFRQQAISLVFQAQYSCSFDRDISYLAINYMDRFLSVQYIPQENPWILRLVIVSCLSLASKMKNVDLSFSDFQIEDKIIFDALTIQRMEILILNALNWRMRSVMPFSFLHFFLSLFSLEDPPLSKTLHIRATDLIFKAQQEIEILGFKPSIVAASALLYASHELFPMQFSSFVTSISSCEYVNKEQLTSCYSLMNETMPVSVFDLNRHTNNISESEITGTTASTRDVKRRKMNYVSAFADATCHY